MALTDENSVLILGAGVSAPFGLPVGSRLIDTIAENLKLQLVNYANKSRFGQDIYQLLTPVNDGKVFDVFPYLQSMFWKINAVDDNLKFSIKGDELKQKFNAQRQKLVELQSLLKNQTSDSIDDFIIMNPSFSEYVKICIAAEFMSVLYQKNTPPSGYTDWVLHGIDNRYLPHHPSKNEKDKKPKKERNWIHRLINLIRLGVKEGKVTPENKVKIITFNYDTILEYVLEKQFLNTEYFEKLKKRKPDQEISYEDYIEIIHVHGQCGKLEKKLEIPSKTCWEWAKDIHVIREGDDNLDENNKELPEEVLRKRKDAQDWIKNATKIYAAGFAFAKANTDLLGLKEGKPACQIRAINYCNFGDDIGLRNAAEKFIYQKAGWRSQVIEQKEIGVSDWIGNGTLGELP